MNDLRAVVIDFDGPRINGRFAAHEVVRATVEHYSETWQIRLEPSASRVRNRNRAESF
jgi:hypothetical protein